MPNLVSHHLTITGPEAELERFMEECFSEGENGLYLDFNKLLPMPARIEKSIEQPSVQAGTGEPCKGDLYGLGSSERFLPAWYVWSVRHWGTKWNACYTEVARDGAAIKLHFDTAWDIPWPIYEELADFFPQLTIEGEIFEPMMEFGGHIRCHAGKIDYEDKSEQIAEDRERALQPPAAVGDVNLGDEDIPF
jgi:hypothetical protein